MSKILLALILLIFLFGCEDEDRVQAPPGYMCYDAYYSKESGNCSSRAHIYRRNCNTEKRAKFIIDCARAANPMSDEEGEDLVKQCEKTSRNLFCEKEYLNQLKEMKEL